VEMPAFLTTLFLLYSFNLVINFKTITVFECSKTLGIEALSVEDISQKIVDLTQLQADDTPSVIKSQNIVEAIIFKCHVAVHKWMIYNLG